MSDKPKPIDCAECGTTIPDPDTEGAYWVEGVKGDVCRECYDDIVKTCQICGSDDVMPSDVSEFILVKAELARTGDIPPGIYRIMHRPFLSIPMVGSGSISENDVLFIDKLPKLDAHYVISGHTCKKCAAPYQEIYKRVYAFRPELKPKLRSLRGLRGWQAKWEGFLKGWSGEGWAIEREHTRSTILANPDIPRILLHGLSGREALLAIPTDTPRRFTFPGTHLAARPDVSPSKQVFIHRTRASDLP